MEILYKICFWFISQTLSRFKVYQLFMDNVIFVGCVKFVSGNLWLIQYCWTHVSVWRNLEKSINHHNHIDGYLKIVEIEFFRYRSMFKYELWNDFHFKGKTYSHCQNFVSLFHVLVQLSFTISEVKLDYYH